MESIAEIAGIAADELLVPGHIVEKAGLVFWAAAAPYLLSSLFSALSLVLSFSSKAQRARVVMARLGLIALVFGVITTGVLVQFFRSRFLAGVSCGNPHCSVTENLIAEGKVLVAAGLAACVLAALGAVAILMAHGWTRRWPALDVALCGMLAFLGVVARRLGVTLDVAITRGDGAWLPRENLEAFATVWAESRGTLVSGFIVCAVLSAGVWTAVALRRRHECTRADLAIGVLVLVSGVGAFAATRKHAYDTKHLAPHVELYWDLIEPWRLPPPRACGANQGLLPLVAFDRGVVSLNGTIMGPVGGPGVRESAREKLLHLRRQYEELRELSRAEPDPSALSIDLLAQPETPMAQVVPVLEAIREAGYPEANVGSLLPNVTNTRTLGPLVRYSRCATAFDLAGDGELPTSFATWGDLARAAGDRRLRLNVGPPALPSP